MRLVFLFPTARVFDEMRASYLAVSEQDSTVEVKGPEGESFIPHANEHTAFICFHRPSASIMQQARRAKVFFVYCEPLGPVSGMTGDGRAYMTSLQSIAHLFDGILVHTPDMRTLMRMTLAEWGVNIPVGVFEAGLHLDAVVQPDFTTPKDIEFLFYGAMAGKRAWSVPLLKEKLGSRLCIAEGYYGKALGALLNRSKVSLYIAHSDVTSFSTWRIWQTMATSAALAIECLDGQEADAYPLMPYEHYLPLPKLTRFNVDEFVNKLVKWPSIRPLGAAVMAGTGYYRAGACIGRLAYDIENMFTSRKGGSK